MRRRFFWVLVWLGMVCATGARADFLGVDNATIHVAAPDGYCLLAPSDVRYNELRDGYEGPDRKGWVRAIFSTCTPPGHRPLLPEIAGYIVALPRDPNFPTPDRERSRWVRSRRLPNSDSLTQIGAEPKNDAAFYFHAIRSSSKFYDDTWIEATALTIVRNTPVEVTVSRLVGHYDVAGGATALEESKALLGATMKRFGDQNGVDFVHVVSDEQAQAVLALSVAAFVDVAGAILMITLAVRRLWVQAALGASLAVAGVLIYRAAPGAGVLLANPVGDIALWAAAAVVFVGLANGFWLLLNLIPVRGERLTNRLRATISPKNWAGAADPQGAAADFTKRWFVTVAAATGSVVFAMLGREGFLDELRDAFSPSRIIFTLLATVVSVTLIGPVEEFIFGVRMAAKPHDADAAPAAHPEEASRFEQLLELVSPRALGRLALVMVFMLMLTAMHGLIEARVHDSKGEDITLMLVAGVAPAILTYYLCAALQRGVAPVARRASLAAALAGLLILGIPDVLVSIGDAAASVMLKLRGFNDYPVYAWGVLVFQAPLTLLIKFASFGALAFAAGAVIDLSLRRRLSPGMTVALIGAVLASLVALFQLVADGVVAGLLHDPDPDRMMMAKSELLAIAGWVFGLVVSGFPTVLQTGAELTQRPKAD